MRFLITFDDGRRSKGGGVERGKSKRLFTPSKIIMWVAFFLLWRLLLDVKGLFLLLGVSPPFRWPFLLLLGIFSM